MGRHLNISRPPVADQLAERFHSETRLSQVGRDFQEVIVGPALRWAGHRIFVNLECDYRFAMPW